MKVLALIYLEWPPANVLVSANNLFILTKYTGVDPEIGYGSYGAATDSGQTPRSRSYTLGITVDF